MDRLADLYNKEMNDWKLECKSRIETPEQRKAAYVHIGILLYLL